MALTGGGKTCTSIELYVEWLRGYIWAKGYRDVVLAGHSMGGAITQLYALTYPEELKGIILVGTGARLRVHPDYLRQCEEASQDQGKLQQWLKDREATLAKVEPQLRQLLLKKAAEVGPAVQLSDFLCCDRFDVMDRLGELRLPTLVMCGSEDVMTPVKYTAYLAAKIPGARKHIYQGATHSVPNELPDHVNGAIQEFIASL
ncbi:MAG: alpha/beta hydrolase [Chloroflexi bacterium]|nr:alpha/beta hydrolase [Chloroflexota bacterium]